MTELMRRRRALMSTQGGAEEVKSVHFLTTLNFTSSNNETYQIPSDVASKCNIYLLHIQLSAPDNVTDINVNNPSSGYRVARLTAAQASDYKTLLATIPELLAGSITFPERSVSGPTANLVSYNASSIIIRGTSLTGTVDIWGYY